MVFEVKAITWDGRRSFSMIGAYGVDDFGRFVLGKNGVRYDIPADAIVERLAIQVQDLTTPPSPPVVKEEEPPVATPLKQAPPPAPPKPCPLPRLQPLQTTNAEATAKKEKKAPSPKKTSEKKR